MTYPNPLVTQEKVRRLARRRRRARRARVASLTVLVVVVVGAAAVGVDRAVVYAQRLWAEHHRPAPAPPAAPTSISTTSTFPGPPLCTPGQFHAYLYGWRITGETLYEVVALANASSMPCTVAGYAAFFVSSPGGGPLPAPVRDDPALGASGGASTTPAAVPPGQQAWFELTYPVACTAVLTGGQQASGAPGECYQGASLGIVVPRATAALTVAQPLRFTYGVAGFTVGPFGVGTPPSSPPVG